MTLTKENLPKEFAAARDAAYLRLGQGSTSAVRVGHTGLAESEIVANVVAAAAAVAAMTPGEVGQRAARGEGYRLAPTFRGARACVCVCVPAGARHPVSEPQV